MDRRLFVLGAAALSSPFTALAQSAAFDHTHADWTALLKKHVVLQRGGQASQANYAGFAADRSALQAYLAQLSSVTRAAFGGFTKAQQQAFLTNVYNAFTVELILGQHPDLKSIRDLGSIFTSPWQRKWFDLLGTRVSLDEVEHGMLRERGTYDEPRVHFAVNCASIGCPLLREEAFVADRLPAQLAEQTQRFMSDRTRNRWNSQRSRMEISKIFDWYGEDFELGHQGIASLKAFLGSFADSLADAPADRERIRSGQFSITFLDYDWALNDVVEPA